MPTLADIRQQYPQYSDLSDEALAGALHKKFYSDMPRDQFDAKIGYTPKAGTPTFRAKPASEREGTYRAVAGPEFGTQKYWTMRQQEVEKQLRAKGKTDEQIQSDPEWQEAARGVAQSVSAGATGTAVGALTGEAAGAAAAPVLRPVVRAGATALREGVGAGARELGESIAEGGRAIKAGAQRVGETLGKAPGVKTVKTAVSKAPQEAQAAAEAAARELRTTAVREAETGAKAQEAAAAKAERQAAGVEKTAKGIVAKQPLKAQERADRALMRPDEIRQNVLAQTRDRVRQAEADYRAAGSSTQAARDLAMQAEAQHQAAVDAVSAFDQQLAARPTTTPEQFGQLIRNATKSISDRFGQARATQAKFGEAIASAGDEARVPTKDIVDLIDSRMKDIRNPTLRNTLQDLRAEMLTDDKEALNLKSAESLRGTLDSIIQQKIFKDRKIDKETLQIVSTIRKELVSSAKKSWPPYEQALKRWRELSKPLDIVERKGALKKVLDVDPVSTDYAKTESEVVGEVIRKAQAGSPVFTRLLQENPELRDAARLYFTRDLMAGKEKLTPASLANWLKANEQPLKQLGLYDEFRNVQLARRAAQNAVDQAKGVKIQTAKEVKAAAAREAEEARRLKTQETIREMARKRAEESPTAKVVQRKVVPKSSLAAKETPKEAVGRLESRAGKLRSQAEKMRSLKSDLSTHQVKLEEARPEDLPTEAKSFALSLKNKGLIDDVRYRAYLRKVDEVKQAYEASSKAAADKAAARAKLKRIAKAITGVAVLGEIGYRGYQIWNRLF